MSASETSADRVTFRGEEGIELIGDAVGDPSAPPVLLLHGGGQTRHSWQGTAASLADAGWYAIRVDQRGHGDSAWHPEAAYAFSDYAADVREIVPTLSQPPVLIGASLGGIAALFAEGVTEGNFAAGLVLVDVAPQIEVDGAQRIVEFMREKMTEGFASLDEVADSVAAYNPHRPRPTDLSGLEKNLRKRDGRWFWHWDPAFIDGGDRFREDQWDVLERAARNVSIPTLLVRGKLSDLLSEEGAQAFLTLVPHAKYTDVSGAGHMVAGDKNDAFTRAIVDFLRDDVSSALR